MNRALSLLGVALLAVGAASCRDYAPDPENAPEQPIAFYHSVHAGQNQIPCQYCHTSVDRSPSAGVPAVSVCAGCHVLGSANPALDRSAAALAFPLASRDTFWNAEASKIVEYWKAGQPIPWVRIHRLPEHAKFPHNVHVNVGLQCQTCHGPVEEMEKVYQFSSLRMGWCIECHRGEMPLSEGERAAVMERSSFRRQMEALRAQGTSVAGWENTYPNQIATTDCMACHY